MGIKTGSGDELSPREHILYAFEHKETLRTPFSLGFGVSPPAKLHLMKHLGHTNINQTDEYLLKFDDIRHVYIPYIGPRDKNVRLPGGETIDIWNVRRMPVTYTEGGVYEEICCHPMADFKSVSDLDSFDWPNPDWFDYSALPDILNQLNPDRKYAVRLGNGNLFENTWHMRGFEQSLLDIAAQPEFIDAILQRVTSFFMIYFKRALSAAHGLIDIAFTADDIAGQTGMLFSPNSWKELIKPYHKKMNDLLHEFGVKILYHTDGDAHAVIEDLIDMGIDAWEALQLDCEGMDAKSLKETAGNRLTFHGGISVQQLLPFENHEKVKSEITGIIKCLGKGSGYIAAPSHFIQAGTPPENILAMLETVRPDIYNKIT